MLKLRNHFFGFFKNWFSFFKKWPLWDLANVKRNKVMKFGNSNHQNVKMPDWVWSSGPDLAPLSRNRVNSSSILLLLKPEVLYCICIGEILWRCKKEKNLCIIVEKKLNFCIVVGFHYSAYIIVTQVGKFKNHKYLIESLSIYSIFWKFQTAAFWNNLTSL